MERLQHPLVLSPCVPPSHLSLTVYNKPFQFFFLRYGDAPPFGTTIIPIGEQIDPVLYDGGHNMQVFSATPVRITFECPVFVVLRDTKRWSSMIISD
jgi:hypothetical protein